MMRSRISRREFIQNSAGAAGAYVGEHRYLSRRGRLGARRRGGFLRAIAYASELSAWGCRVPGC